MKRFITCLLCVLTLLSLVKANNNTVGHPIAFVHGILGSILHAKAENIPDHHIPLLCPRNHKEFPIWVNILFDFDFSCFCHYLKMNFSATTGKWTNTPGVTISIPKEGTIYPVDILDAETTKVARYLHKFISTLENHGYTDGVNLTACAYDWRQLPNEEWAEKCRGYIEKMVKTSGKKAIFIGHSMGGPYSYYVLRTAPSGWVEKYIHRYITPSPAWLGAPAGFVSVFNGLSNEFPPALGDYFAPMARNIPALWFLFPWSDAYKDIPAVKTPKNTYYWNEITKILTMLGIEQADLKLKSVLDVFSRLNSYEEMPNVPMITTFATDLKTAYTYVFKEELTKQDPMGKWMQPKEELYGAGDATVPDFSLKYATDKWMKKYPHRNITYVDASGIDHSNIVLTDKFFNMILDEAFHDY